MTTKAAAAVLAFFLASAGMAHAEDVAPYASQVSLTTPISAPSPGLSAGFSASSPAITGAQDVDPLAYAPGEQPSMEPSKAPDAGVQPTGAQRFVAASAIAMSLDTPVKDICATQAGRAVIDRDMPGLTTHPMYFQFKRMTLRQLAGMSMGRITSEDLQRVSQDLASLR